MGHSKPVLVWSGIVSIGLAIVVVQWIGTKPVAADDKQDHSGSAEKKGAPLKTQDISLEQAQTIVAAAVKKSQEMHINQNIAVVDAGGNLKAFARMDNAWLGRIDI